MTNAHSGQLTKQAAQLLRAVAPVRAHPQAPALARDAARLLRVQPTTAAERTAPVRESAFEKQRAGMVQGTPGPVTAWTKLRRLFGKQS